VGKAEENTANLFKVLCVKAKILTGQVPNKNQMRYCLKQMASN